MLALLTDGTAMYWHKPHSLSKVRRGVSYLEIILVLVLLGIISALVIPSGNTDESKLRNAAQLLIADLEFAQLASMGNGGDPCILVFNTVDNEYHLARVSAPESPLDSSGMAGTYVTQYGSARGAALQGVVLATLDMGGDNQLGFTVGGSLDQNSDATIEMHSGAKSMTIVVDAVTGEPRLQ